METGIVTEASGHPVDRRAASGRGSGEDEGRAHVLQGSMRRMVDAELGREVYAPERRARHRPKGADGMCPQQPGRGLE